MDILERFKAATAKVGAAQLAGPAQPAAQPARPRLIFAMDATASREPTWDVACSNVAAMFDAAGRVGGLSVQLVHYGGATLPRGSPWVSDVRRLTNAMTMVRCRGGATQIEAVLSHIRREHARQPVAAFVYIGDTIEEARSVLVSAAATLGVKGFIFHERIDHNPVDASIFQEIARVSGGVYLPFDQDSAGHFRGLLAGIAAFAAGGRAALEARKDAGSQLLLSKL